MEGAEAKPLISVVIVSYNVKEHLLATLRSLHASNGVSIDVVVVDNASSDGSADAVKTDFPQTTVVCNDTNLGFGKANNRGIERTRGEFVLLLNPDVIVDRDCVKIL